MSDWLFIIAGLFGAAWTIPAYHYGKAAGLKDAQEKYFPAYREEVLADARKILFEHFPELREEEEWKYWEVRSWEQVRAERLATYTRRQLREHERGLRRAERRLWVRIWVYRLTRWDIG